MNVTPSNTHVDGTRAGVCLDTLLRLLASTFFKYCTNVSRPLSKGWMQRRTWQQQLSLHCWSKVDSDNSNAEIHSWSGHDPQLYSTCTVENEYVGISKVWVWYSRIAPLKALWLLSWGKRLLRSLIYQFNCSFCATILEQLLFGPWELVICQSTDVSYTFNLGNGASHTLQG